jgi:deazaflavin-dependent oxidoreductase (nitroreductase family)
MTTENADELFGPEHVKRYRETDGKVGHDWRGASVLLLTTRGRRSGNERITPLLYQPYEGSYLVVASKGGAPQPPAWYLNLEEHPEVEVQIRGDRFSARARTAEAEEKPEMWRTMTEVWPDYDAYQERTDRDIPVVVLERS